MVSSWDKLGDRQLGTSHKGSCSDFLSCPVYTGKGFPHAVNTAQEEGRQLLQGQSGAPQEGPLSSRRRRPRLGEIGDIPAHNSLPNINIMPATWVILNFLVATV